MKETEEVLEERRRIAKLMIEDNVPFSRINRYTGLSHDELNSLLKQYHEQIVIDALTIKYGRNYAEASHVSFEEALKGLGIIEPDEIKRYVEMEKVEE